MDVEVGTCLDSFVRRLPNPNPNPSLGPDPDSKPIANPKPSNFNSEAVSKPRKVEHFRGVLQVSRG
eukprot:6183404-Pleurochrysis_carterae.AAC.5